MSISHRDARAELAQHYSHEIEVALYDEGNEVTIDCLDCMTVLFSGQDLEDAWAEAMEEYD